MSNNFIPCPILFFSEILYQTHMSSLNGSGYNYFSGICLHESEI